VVENEIISCGKSEQGEPQKTKVLGQEEQRVVNLTKQGMGYDNKKEWQLRQGE
jgi:hypothetical protein